MAIELLYADAHITGGFVNPNNALSDTPGTWAGELNTGSSYTSRWAIANPVDPLTSGATQTIRTVARKGSNSGDPTIQLNLYESGTLVSSLTTAVTVTSTTGQTILGTFASSAITNRNNVEIEVVETGPGGNPSTRNSAQISLIEWQAETGAAVPDPKTATLIEDFATADTGTWTGYDADTTVTGGRLRMTYLAASNILDTVADYDLSDSSVFAEVYHTEGAGTGASNETFFGVGPAGSIFAGTHYLFDINITDLYFRIYSGSVADDGVGPITYDPATMRWLRIRHAGGQVHWDTSPDGSTWTNRRSATPAVSVTSLRVKFVAFNFQENQATFAEYDNVNNAGPVGGTGELTAVLPELTGSLTADATTTGTLTGQTPAVTASIQGTASATGDLAVVLPELTASFTTDDTQTGTLAAVLPELTGSFTADAAGGAAPTLDATLLYNNPSPETDGSGHTTGSVTPAADSLILVCVGTAIALEIAPTVDSITSGFAVGTAWAQVKDHVYSSTGVRRGSVWRAVTGASPGSGTINVTFSGASTSTFVAVVQITGAGTATPIIQSSSGDGSSNTPSVPLAAAAKGTNRPFAFSTIRSATTHTPRAGWTELLDQSHSAPGMGYEIQWRSDAFDTTADCLAGASANWGIIALEIDAAGAVGGTAELSATLPELTGSLTAEATGTAALAGTLPEPATAFTGQASTEGQIAGTLPGLASSLTADATGTGTLTGTLPELASSLAGQASTEGLLAGTFPEPVTALFGTASANATLAATLPELAGSFTASADTGGATLAAVLPELTGSLTGFASTAGVLAGTLPALTGAIDLAALVDGAMAVTLPALEAQFLGTASASAVLTATLPALEMELAEQREISAFRIDDLTGPGIVPSPAVTGPAFARTVTGPGFARTVTGTGIPASAVTDGIVAEDITGPGIAHEEATGPAFARTLTGSGV